jgi:hypothetical protein
VGVVLLSWLEVTMALSGTHANALGWEIANRVLKPLGACKICIYEAAALIAVNYNKYGRDCSRCGLSWMVRNQRIELDDHK